MSTGQTRDEHAIEGLRRARRLQAALRHPNILSVVDFFEKQGEHFSVFEHVPGAQSLHETIERIRAGRRPPCGIDEFVTLSAGVTEGLAAIHQEGFVHRTLGTHNVLIGRDRPLLADLGCATPVGATDAAARAFRSFMRPTSAAPEQFADDSVFSPAIDNWALGVALFELRYGRHPFWTDPPSTIDGVRTAIAGGTAEFPPLTIEAEDRLLQPWLQRLLEKDPRKRYSDALEAQRDLEAIAAEIEGRPALARAFVAMPFADGFDGLWRAIRSACAACRISVRRVDQSYQHESIWEEICAAIVSTDFMVAVTAPDASGAPNPNVMLEIGYARALQKPVLLLADAPNTLPFDLRTQRALVYEESSVSGGRFYRELVAMLRGIEPRCSDATRERLNG